MTLNSFKPSVSGDIGEFSGAGPSYLATNPNGAGNNGTFNVRNNAKNYSNSYLKLKENEFRAARGEPPDTRSIVGLTVRSAPLTNYTGFDVKNLMDVLRTQIHELGHSLDVITSMGYDDRDKHPNRPDLGGKILEDCVRRRGGFRYR